MPVTVAEIKSKKSLAKRVANGRQKVHRSIRTKTGVIAPYLLSQSISKFSYRPYANEHVQFGYANAARNYRSGRAWQSNVQVLVDIDISSTDQYVHYGGINRQVTESQQATGFIQSHA